MNRLDLTETQLGGLPELQEKGAEEEMTKGAVGGVTEQVKPDSPAVRKTLKGVAAGAAAAGAAAAAKVVADRVRDRSNGSQGESDSDS